MHESDRPLEELDRWLGEIHKGMQRLLDLEDPMEPARRCEQLLNMSQRFLALSRTFLEMGQQASAAAESLMRPPPAGA
jgi:hypothetical protein